MALTVTSGLVVSAGTQQPQVDTFGELKVCVAATFQAENQPAILVLAGRGIQRAVDWVNMHHRMRFGSKQSSDAALVAGTDTVSLSADFFAVHEIQLIDADSKVYSTLQYIPWGQWNDAIAKHNHEGEPLYWTSRNAFDDNAVQIYPVPDANAAAAYTTRLTYYERVTRPTADTDIIDAPRELGLVLCTYAEYYVAFARNREDPAAWGSKLREARKLLATFVNSVEDEPTAHLRFRLDWDRGSSSGQFDPLR